MQCFQIIRRVAIAMMLCTLVMGQGCPSPSPLPPDDDKSVVPDEPEMPETRPDDNTLPNDQGQPTDQVHEPAPLPILPEVAPPVSDPAAMPDSEPWGDTSTLAPEPDPAQVESAPNPEWVESDPAPAPPADGFTGDAAAALPGSCGQGLLYGDINGLEAVAQVQGNVLRRGLAVGDGEVFVGDAYMLFAGEIQSGPYVYVFQAEIIGSSGYGDLAGYDGTRMRIRIDLVPDGFWLSTGVFENGCGENGCGQHLFTCR